MTEMAAGAQPEERTLPSFSPSSVLSPWMWPHIRARAHQLGLVMLERVTLSEEKESYENQKEAQKEEIAFQDNIVISKHCTINDS